MSIGPNEARVRRQLAGDIHLGDKVGGGELWYPREAFTEHAHFIGPTGVGKTRLLQHIAQQLIDADDCCVLVLDPHDAPAPDGGMFHALKAHCYANDHVDRLLTVDLDEIHRHGLVTGFNPMTRGRSLAVRAALAAESLRSVAGVTDPTAALQLFKWSFNTFLGLHIASLPFADAQSILDSDDRAYREALPAILQEKYPHVAGAWRRLAADDKRSRSAQSAFDYECGSTQRRIDNYLNNEFIHTLLSTHQFAFSPSQAIAEGKVVLCNLAPRDLMDSHHRKMLGTQLLHAFCRAAMDRADHDTVPCFVIADEFHELLCPEVLEILNGGRKFGIHLILAHQFLGQLQDVAKQDWRYLGAVLTNPAVRGVFGGLQWEDAEKFTLEMLNEEIDLKKIKNEIWGTVQTSRVEWMDLRTQMSAHASGDSWSRDTTHAGGGSTTHTSDPGRPGSFVESVGTNFADAYRAATSGNSADMTGESVANVPVTLPNDPELELRSVEYWSKDEQLFQLARELKNQPRQHAAFYRRGGRTEYGRIAQVDNPRLTVAELWGPDRDRLLAAAALPSPVVASVELIEEEARERDRVFRENLALPPHLEQLDPAPTAIQRRRDAVRRRS